MRFQDLSIQVKIVLALALTFSVLLVVSAVFINSSQRELVTKLASEKVDDIANTYFDGVNTMMLTGTTTQRTILKSKMLESENVVDVTILRSEELISIFGKGIEGELATSAEDQRALKGESFQLLEDTDQGRQVTTWLPLKASSNYRGTNCLTCHAVPEGTVLGAVKATYSMAASDRKVTGSLIKSTLINLLLFAVGIGVILWILRKLLVKPIVNIRQVMHEAAQNSDVTTRLPVHAQDEIGTLASAINEMLGSFQSSIKNVIETAHRVSQAAGQISQVSEATYNAAYSQLSETNNVATAMTELAASANEVNESADKTANASVSADKETSIGRNMTEQAVSGIHHLITEIENAADVINLLDDRSQGIGQVLDVIRSIAEQTNLLALNAAIEAARAGESGRGFAVVADEVRNLANRSHESTEEIQQLIEQLQTDAKKAVETMTNARESATERGSQIEAAGNSLTSIAEQVGQIRELNTQMANAAREQSLVTEDVTKNISSISQIAQDTSLDAQKVNDFSQELVKLSNELKQLVDRFTV